ncbi:NDR1/HIN1-like protein 6 [Magnolia sinica]|uniref:NDR1/HIN1-like protein 6 n=1 Tax=Magnolia sinica TaxID=86752 RepID=UPI00265B4924|nr:NDR1/HIN1-like protein 6 [Magnolia sinica]
MAENQRIHPVDVETPLAPRDNLKSEKGDPVNQYQPIRRTIPVRYSKPPKKRSCCCRCFCWTISFLLILLIAIAVSAGILYLVFRPKLPKYSIDRLMISDFTVDPNMNLQAGFDVTITARNPNKKIGIYYEDGSELSAWYSDINLCTGSLPKFYQGHRNTTVLNVALTGQTQLGSTLMTALTEQQQTGRIPLVVRARVPVRVKVGRLKLWKVKFLVRCNLVVDSLSANNQISIKTSSCKFRLRR